MIKIRKEELRELREAKREGEELKVGSYDYTGSLSAHPLATPSNWTLFQSL